MTHREKLLLVAPALLLALSGCSGGKKAETPADVAVPTPALLSVTASRPAGTLDSLPDLAWTLTGATGLSLVVRAQGPGASAPGVGFAGVRVASGPLRYLAADGTWSETEVAYAAAAGTTGTIHPTAPLRLEGEWRFDVLVKDAGGALQALAMAPVLLSGKPAIRVSLSRRFAVDGDTVTGSVALARGGAPTPVRLLAWWQGPGGVNDRLPAGVPLAFDGPSDDVELPLLARPLDGAAPGAWSLVARLFDAATGAPLSYGEQTLQVCAGAVAVIGTALGVDGSPLGAGTRLASVQAISLDRTGGQRAAIGADGGFGFDLLPGAWALTGFFLDATGAHRLSPQAVQVGCDGVAPIVLAAEVPAPPATLARRTLDAAQGSPPRPVASAVTHHRSSAPVRLAAPAATVSSSTATCQAAATATLPLASILTPAAKHIVSEGKHRSIVEAIPAAVSLSTSNQVSFLSMWSYAQLLELVSTKARLGVDAPSLMRDLPSMLKLDVVGVLIVDRKSDTEVYLDLQLADRNGFLFRGLHRSATLEAAEEVAYAMGEEIATLPGPLMPAIRAKLDYPRKPNITVGATFGSVLPSSQHTVTVHVRDCDGAGYQGNEVTMERRPVSFPAKVTALTDANGDATFSLLLGLGENEETLSASYDRNNGDTFRAAAFTYAVQRAQVGQLQFAPTVPVIRPGGSAVLRITSRDPVTGAPQPIKTVVIRGDLGGLLQEASVVTDATGTAEVALPAGGTPGLGRATAFLPHPPPASRALHLVSAGQPVADLAPLPANDGETSEYLVVSSPVALSFEGPSAPVPVGGVVRLIGSLFLDGVPMVGTTVALASSGGGTLTSDGAPVDEAGGFEATLRLPLSGTGAATITASVQVEGQTVTRDVPVAWVDGVKRIAFSCPSLTSPYGTDLCTINPDGTGQARVVVDGAAPAWSHDRSRIAFSLHGALTLVNPDGSGLFTVPLPAGTTASSLSWSPDDTQLAFQELGPTVPITVCFVGTDGGGHRCLPPTLLNFNANGWVPSAWAPQPSWSPDGTRIAFVGSTFLGAGPPTSFAFTYDIYVMNVDGSGAANVTMNSGTVRGLNPAWSPDGTKLAYVRENGATFKYDIYVTTPGGGAGTPVTSSGYAVDPTWSPDGSRIAYADDSSLAVMVINADGTSVPTALAPGSTPAW